MISPDDDMVNENVNNFEVTVTVGHFLFFLFCPKLFRISENVRTISENVRTFHLSEAKLIFSLLIFHPKNVFINFVIQVFIRCSI